jgi:hypothetical protein
MFFLKIQDLLVQHKSYLLDSIAYIYSLKISQAAVTKLLHPDSETPVPYSTKINISVTVNRKDKQVCLQFIQRIDRPTHENS